MKAQAENHPSENRGTRQADRMSDQGGRRSQQAEKTRQAKAGKATAPDRPKQK